MSNYKDFRNKDTAFTGTKGIDLPTGTTGERDTGYGSGTLRYNSTTNLMEYYNGSDWKAVDAPPVVTNFNIDGGSAITSYTIDDESTGNVTMTINGSLFDTTGADITMIANSGSNVSPDSTTRNSANLITCVFDASDFNEANGPYTLKVTNGSGLAATLADAVTADQAAPVFTNSADTIYSLYDSLRSSGTIQPGDLCGATDADGESLTYSVQTGSLPTGFTLNTSTGAITWSSVSAVGSDTTSTFTIRVTDGTTNVDRQFKITIKPPVRTTYNSPATFAVPTGVSAVDVMLVAGGGGAGGFGGGGAGGLIYRPGFTVSPGTQVTVTIGQGGAAGAEGGGDSYEGQDSVFGTLTAKGGGGGGQANYGPDLPENENVGDGEPGGSGGGGGHPNNTALGGNGGQAGAATQPTQPGDSGTYGFGNPGGRGRNNVSPNSPEPVSTAGGGGGAGGAGGDGDAQSTQHGGAGGVGKAYSIADGSTQVYYAGGGGGSYGGEPGNGGGGSGNTQTSQNAGTANRGGGGGTRYSGGQGQGGAGGSGVVIVSY